MRASVPLLLGAIGLSACRVEQILDVAPVATVEVSAPYPAISPGEVHQLRVTLRDAEGDDLGPRRTVWRSLDPSFVTVDDSGRATGVAVGVARLVASSEGRADTIALPVRSSWSRVWAGYRMVCAERIAGGTYCWGDVPGDGSTGTSFVPVPLPGGMTLRSIKRTSIDVTCGLNSSGAYFCWDGRAYLPGEYGNGADSAHGPLPRQGASGLLLRAFGGTYGMCAAGMDGTGWCWGQVDYGVDTVTHFNYRDAPDTVLGGISWRTLQQGEWGACGLDQAGAAYCFGSAYALLGQGPSIVARKLPSPVVGGHLFDSLYVDFRHVCGLTGSGEAWCWGEGELGDGGGYRTTGTPVLVLGGHHFRALRQAFGSSFCGLTTENEIWCWGSTPTRVETPFPFVDVAGSSTNSCGLTAGGGLYCTGFGLLGDGGIGPNDGYTRVADPE